MNKKPISQKEAESKKYRPMTTTYYLPKEQWMLDNIISDMERGDIDAVLVESRGGVEVWRR